MKKVMYDFNEFNKKGVNAMEKYHKKITPALIKRINNYYSGKKDKIFYDEVTFESVIENGYHEISRVRKTLYL